MDNDEDRAVAKQKRLKELGWNLIEWGYFRHPHETVSGVVLAALFIFSILMLVIFGVSIWTLIEKLGDTEHGADNARNLLLTFGAVIAAPFVVWRTWIAHQQWQVGVDQAKTQIETMQTGLLTKAIEQLGAMREDKVAFLNNEGKWENRVETVPNIEVRLGAIYLLKRLAEDNDRDHAPILETLCAYVRENSRQEWKKWSRQELKRQGRTTNNALEVDLLEPMPQDVAESAATGGELHRNWRKNKPPLREDIQSALRVIGDRNLSNKRRLFERQPTLSLAGSFLVGAQLQNTILENVDFQQAHCQAADFSKSELIHVDFSGSHLQDASFYESNCRRSKFHNAFCQGALFDGAKCWQVSFIFTDLRSAMFNNADCRRASFRHSKCQDAEFTSARLQGSEFYRTNLKDTFFDDADLRYVNFDNSDLSSSSGLTTENLKFAFGDRRTILPDQLERPPVGINWPSAIRENRIPYDHAERRSEIIRQQSQVLAELA